MAFRLFPPHCWVPGRKRRCQPVNRWQPVIASSSSSSLACVRPQLTYLIVKTILPHPHPLSPALRLENGSMSHVSKEVFQRTTQPSWCSFSFSWYRFCGDATQTIHWWVGVGMWGTWGWGGKGWGAGGLEADDAQAQAQTQFALFHL